MKAPKIAEIPEATPATSFSEQAKQAKRTLKGSEKAVKRSFSLKPDDAKYIDKIALQLGQKREKSMSSSEALRVIINDHRERT